VPPGLRESGYAAAVTAPPTPFRIPAGPFPFEPRLPVPPATDHRILDVALADLRRMAPRWPAVPPNERIRLLEAAMRATAAVADRWIDLAARAEGLDPFHLAAAEEALVGPMLVARGLRYHRDSLRDIARGRAPRIAGPITARPDGRTVARVFPTSLLEAGLYLGDRAEVWFAPGVGPSDVVARQAGAYRSTEAAPGAVCLVLGAGNVSSIGPLDVVHKLFVENRVVILKTHPVQAHLAEVIEAALAPLVEAGVLRIVHGDGVQGGYLANHPDVDELHITGSDRTYDAIVFGPGADGAERKARDEPVLHKPFSAELGNVTPIIVVPGPWSASDLEYHADNIASMLTNNAGFNCVAARVVVTHASWPLRTALLDGIRARLAATPTRSAYYPGAAARHAAFVEAHPEAEQFDGSGAHHAARAGTAADGADDHLPWTFIAGLDPARPDEPCFGVEAFCSVFGETALDAPDTASFLDAATAFANDRLWGTLNATVIVHPRTAADPAVAPALDRAIAGLRYGTVSLNHWSGIGYGIAVTPWGAYPGHVRTDIGSGVGFVHNPLMLDGIEKVVLRCPFRAWPRPVWFTSHRTADRLGREMTRFEADRSLLRLPRIGYLALRG
jgi:acyl-CoA reductase-like NAD-dependent aldehyde dehydrogenase